MKGTFDPERAVPPLSILIITHNNKELLKACLDSLSRSLYPALETIVIDNVSTDGTDKFLEKYVGEMPNLELVRNRVNNYESAFNLGVKIAKGKYVAKLDDDTKVHPDWLTKLVEVIESDKTIWAACSGRHLEYYEVDRRKNPDGYFGRDLDYLALLHERPKNYCVRDSLEAMTTAILFSKELFNKIGWCDSQFVIYHEEIDIGWKIRLHGYRSVVVPTSLVYHLGPKKGRRPSDMYHARKNRMIILLTNYNAKNAVKYMSLYAFLLLLEGMLNLLVLRDTSSLKNTIGALCYIIRHVRYLYERRCFIQKHVRRVGDDQVMKFMVKFRPSSRLIKAIMHR